MPLSIKMAQVYADPWLSLMSLGFAAGMAADAFMKFVRDSERLISRPSRDTLRKSPGTRYVNGSPVAVLNG
jgi:hypothetical protein